MIISSTGMFHYGIVEMIRTGRAAQTIGAVLALMILSAGYPFATQAKSAYSPPQAAMVVDGYSGEILYSSNADESRYPASITKVMTIYLLFEQIRDGRMTFKTPLKVSAEAASRPPSKLGLKPGSTISVSDAVHALVTKSANDVAAVIAENIGGSEPAFARMMTQKARAIGMTKTTFRNASGLPDAEQITTARDLVTLGRRMRTDFPKLSEVFSTKQFSYGKRKFRNHNRLLFSYDGMEGMKTGFIRASGFNLLATCRRDDKYLIAVVLGGRSGKARNARMRTLLDRSWPKAVALNSYKKSQPISIAGIVEASDLPERNPAFHDVDLGPLPNIADSDITEEEVAEIELAMAEGGNAEPVIEREDVKPVVTTALPVNAVIASAETSAVVEQGAESQPPPGPYHIQVGSFISPKLAESHLSDVSQKANSMLRGHDGHTAHGEVKGKSYYRARYSSFSRNEAASACAALKKLQIDCLVVRVE
jgi:D-alanyl-D-alanine carboxypeptidase